MIQYKWKPAARVSINAQVAGERLAQIRETQGALTPPLIVEEARPSQSPLHPHFEWDDALAARGYREDQARYLLRSIVIVEEAASEPDPDEHPLRAFIPVRADEQDKEMSFEPLHVVMANAELRQQVLQRAWKELESWRQRYHEYEELAQVFAAMEATKELVAV